MPSSSWWLWSSSLLPAILEQSSKGPWEKTSGLCKLSAVHNLMTSLLTPCYCWRPYWLFVRGAAALQEGKTILKTTLTGSHEIGLGRSSSLCPCSSKPFQRAACLNSAWLSFCSAKRHSPAGNPKISICMDWRESLIEVFLDCLVWLKLNLQCRIWNTQCRKRAVPIAGENPMWKACFYMV